MQLPFSPLFRGFSWLIRRTIPYFGILLLLLFLVVAVFDFTSSLRWKRERAEEEKRGVVLFPPAAQPPLPDAENLAASDTPFARRHSDTGSARPEESPSEPKQWLAYTSFIAFDAMPSIAKEQRGGFALVSQSPPSYVRANFTGASGKETSKVEAYTAAEYIRAFETDPAIAAGWKAVTDAEARPSTHTGPGYAKIGTEPELGISYLACRKAAQIHASRAKALIELGRGGEALPEIRGILRLARALSECENKGLISYMIRTALVHLATTQTWNGVAAHAWTSDQMASLEGELASVHLARDWAACMQWERQASNLALEEFASEPIYERYRLVKSDGFFPSLPLCDLGNIRNSQVTLNQFYDRAAEAFSPEGKLNLVNLDSFYDRVSSWTDRVTRIHCVAWMPGLDRARARVTLTEDYLAEARAALAIEQWREANGRLPDSLDLLAPRYLPAPPIDTGTGRPVEYIRDSDTEYHLVCPGKSPAFETPVTDVIDSGSKHPTNIIWSSTGAPAQSPASPPARHNRPRPLW